MFSQRARRFPLLFLECLRPGFEELQQALNWLRKQSRLFHYINHISLDLTVDTSYIRMINKKYFMRLCDVLCHLTTLRTVSLFIAAEAMLLEWILKSDISDNPLDWVKSTRRLPVREKLSVRLLIQEWEWLDDMPEENLEKIREWQETALDKLLLPEILVERVDGETRALAESVKMAGETVGAACHGWMEFEGGIHSVRGVSLFGFKIELLISLSWNLG